MKLWKRLLSLVLCGMMIMGGVPAHAVGNEPLTVVMEAVELPTLETAAQPMNFFGLDESGNPTLKEGNYQRWIDRVDFTDAPYGLSLYQWLEENSDVADPDGLLVDPTGAQQLSNGQYVYLVTQIKGTGQFTYTGNSSTDAQNAWNAVLPTVSANEQEAFAYIITAFSAFDRDHAEVFWLSGQSRMLDSISYGYNARGVVTFTQNLYFVLKSDNFDIRGEKYRDTNTLKSAIYDLYGEGGRVDTILAQVDENANRYEKIKYFNQWLTANNHYNASAGNMSQIAFESISALTGTYGVDAPVCEGYSRALQVLCDRAGIPCVLVDGMAYTGGTRLGHMWNYVAMEDGGWYAVDVTWDDPYTGSDSTHISGYENEEYLLVGGDTVIGSMSFLESHPVTNAVTVGGLGFCNGPVLEANAYDPATAPVTVPTLKAAGFSLSFEDEILANFYYTVSDTADVVSQGMLVFHEDPGTADFEKADAVYDATYVASSDSYIATTAGIAAKEMGDDRYYCAYAWLTDGTYAYSPMYQYSPKKYATSRIANSGDEKLKALCVAMLNYGAAAQEFFGYRTDDLMNAGLTDDQKALVAAYDESLFDGAVKAGPGKVGGFVRTEGFSGMSISVSFEGAFAINYYCAPNAAMAGDLKLYVWDSMDFICASQLTAGNASAVITMENQSDSVYWGQVSGIAAKNLDDTYYVAGVYTDADGIIHCTGVIAYSLSKYCMNNAFGNMGSLAQATAMYGYYAAQYFGN